jgi:hypothetical protein
MKYLFHCNWFELGDQYKYSAGAQSRVKMYFFSSFQTSKDVLVSGASYPGWHATCNYRKSSADCLPSNNLQAPEKEINR